jgi:hypothetical protein
VHMCGVVVCGVWCVVCGGVSGVMVCGVWLCVWGDGVWCAVVCTCVWRGCVRKCVCYSCGACRGCASTSGARSPGPAVVCGGVFVVCGVRSPRVVCVDACGVWCMVCGVSGGARAGATARRCVALRLRGSALLHCRPPPKKGPRGETVGAVWHCVQV